jgi:hypothetical protein
VAAGPATSGNVTGRPPSLLVGPRQPVVRVLPMPLQRRVVRVREIEEIDGGHQTRAVSEWQ